jgi:WD40 repeat protein
VSWADWADKTIKFWTVPELRTLGDATTDFWSELNAPDEAAATITTNYPVWRARNLPFGHGVISLPQRGDKALEMYALGGDSPVHRFEGHDDVVKEFVWRARGGEQADFDDREFQLVTWSKDRTLRIWPVQRELTEKVGFTYGAPIKVLVSRRGAPNITYTKIHEADQQKLLPPPIINPPSGIARQKLAKVDSSTGMTRGGAKTKGVDQLEWLTKVVKNQPSPDSSAAQSRMQSLSRKDSRSTSTGRTGEWMSLKDEVVLVNRLFPRPKINFDKASRRSANLWRAMAVTDLSTDRLAPPQAHHLDERSLGERQSNGIHADPLEFPAKLPILFRSSDF